MVAGAAGGRIRWRRLGGSSAIGDEGSVGEPSLQLNEAQIGSW